MAAIIPIRETAAPVGNFHRVFAGRVLSAADILAGWQRIVKICLPDRAVTKATTIELPAARLWDRDLLIVDASGLGYTLLPHGDDVVYGAVDGVALPPVLRLSPVLSDRHDECDGWAAT